MRTFPCLWWSRWRQLALTVGTFCLVSTAYAPLRACIHGPASYEEVVQEKTEQAFLFHDGNNAHLIIKTDLQSRGVLPPMMAWVIPLPSLPSRYQEESADLFKKLFELTPSPAPGAAGPPTTTAVRSAKPGIRVHAVQTVGSYQIQPIEILSEKSGEELNHWLTRHGFGFIPPDNQEYYLKKGAVFLTVRLNNLTGSRARVKPLHIIYPANHLSVPLKFSSHSGVFNLMLYTWTHKPVNISPPLDLDADPYPYLAAASGAKLDTKLSPVLLRLFGRETGYLTRFESGSFNTPGRLVKDMKSDPIIRIADEGVLEVPKRPLISSSARDVARSPAVPIAAVLLSIVLFLLLKRRNKQQPAA